MIEKIMVLVVEDEDTTMRSLILALKYGDYDVVTAQTGKDALDTIEQHRSGHEPLDFILFDIHLTDMNGLDLIEEIENRNIHLPCLAITGFASRETTRALKDKGYSILEKPFEREELYSRIQTIMASQDADLTRKA